MPILCRPFQLIISVNQQFGQFMYVIVVVCFTYLEGLSRYRNICRTLKGAVLLSIKGLTTYFCGF